MTATPQNESAMSTTTKTMPTPSTLSNDVTKQSPESLQNTDGAPEPSVEMTKMSILVNELSLNSKESPKAASEVGEAADESTKDSSDSKANPSTVPDEDESPAAGTGESDSVSSTETPPAIVVSSQKALEHQLPSGIPIHPADHPDPRLIDALENPRDRLFVIKLEQSMIEFINEKESEAFDLPPTNSYHRLLTHKMAEYYRLTHVADATCASVKIYRGQAARIPMTKLCEWPVTALQIQAKPNSNVAKPMVKIMRRATPSEKGGSDGKGTSTPRKDDSEASSEHGDSSTTTSNAAKTSREEREAAYEKARARIFKDFVESPPETPPPTKHDKPRRRDDDDFSSRSQFFAMHHAVPHPQMYFPQPQYPDASMMMGQQAPQGPQGPMRFNPMSTTFNPSANNFSPAQAGYGPPIQQQRQFPPTSYPDRNYPPPQQPQQPLYPQHGQASQQQRGYFPQQTPPMPNGSFTPPRPAMMQQSYSSNGFSSARSNSQPPIPHQHPTMSAPPQQMNRQPQHPYSQLPNQYSPHQHQQQQRNPASFGWGSPGPVGGVSMHPRSSSAPGHHPGMPESMSVYGAGGPQQPLWNQNNTTWNPPANAAVASRGGGPVNHAMGMGMNMGRGMNMPM